MLVYLCVMLVYLCVMLVYLCVMLVFSVCGVDLSVCDVGLSVCDVGLSVCDLGLSVCDLGFSVCGVGLYVCDVGLMVCFCVFLMVPWVCLWSAIVLFPSNNHLGWSRTVGRCNKCPHFLFRIIIPQWHGIGKWGIAKVSGMCCVCI